MTIRLFLITVFLLASGVARAQFGGGTTEGYILFKDGFTIHGRIVQQKQREVDPSSGIAIYIHSPNGFTFIDDEVRRIYFPPGQIEPNKGIVPLKPGDGAYTCEEPLRVLVDLCLGKPVENGASGLVGQRAVEVLDAMYRSASSGRMEAV